MQNSRVGPEYSINHIIGLWVSIQFQIFVVVVYVSAVIMSHKQLFLLENVSQVALRDPSPLHQSFDYSLLMTTKIGIRDSSKKFTSYCHNSIRKISCLPEKRVKDFLFPII